MKERESYKQPPADYDPGDRLYFDGSIYTVIASTHTHTQLEGVAYAVANWELRVYRRAKKKASVNTDKSQVSIKEQLLRISPDPLVAVADLRSAEDINTTAKEDFEARLP